MGVLPGCQNHVSVAASPMSQLHEDGFTGGAAPFRRNSICESPARHRGEDNVKGPDPGGQRANLTSIAEKILRAAYSIAADKSLEDEGFQVKRLELTENFAITKAGITFFYNEDISSHDMGPFFSSCHTQSSTVFLAARP